MKRAVIKFNNEKQSTIPGDRIEFCGEIITVYNGSIMVAVLDPDHIEAVYISEQTNGKSSNM